MSASQPKVSRRAALRLLGAAMLATAAGCRSSKQSDGAQKSASRPGATSARPPSVTIPPSLALAARAADDEKQLIAAYDAAIAAAPELESTLAPLRANHAAHLVGLTPGAPTAPARSKPTSESPTVTPSLATSTVASAAPAGSPAASLRAGALATLAARERTAAAARVDDLMSTDDGSLARLLASIGGCEASHAALLAVAT